MNVKKILVSVSASAVMLGASAIPAFAEANNIPGLDRYLNNLGRQQAGEVGAQCGTGAGSGTFGWLGKDNNMAGGANGYQTGLNNSGVCGNRQ
ncbi:MAG: hypothetical protein ACD_61C00040G0008 [uncultured bacterium]|nr:MAG: hypothetical protein ACD_61C00040G0008 [uncultured bacterium]